MATTDEITQKLYTVMNAGNCTARFYKTNYYDVTVQSDDIAAGIMLDDRTLKLDVWNKQDGCKIGSLHYNLTGKQEFIIRDILMEAYWPR